MKQFAPMLKNINERLDLPQPTKSRIILEIACDLEDAFNRYLAKGLSEQEAVKEAEERFDLTDESLDELKQIHQTFFKKLVDSISGRVRTRWERAALVMVFLFIIALSAKTIFTTNFLLQASKFTFPILGIFLITLLISCTKFYQLFIKKDHVISNVRSRLSSITVLGSINIFLGIFGYIFELFTADKTTMYSGFFNSIITVIKLTDELFFKSAELIMRCASMAMVCTFVTITTALIYFILLNKIQKIEQAEAAFLLEE